ncbi:MAG: tetratricopeptide repeat protein [bacterium]|nr:tetratricopeptide repeat protein [bacterium]
MSNRTQWTVCLIFVTLLVIVSSIYPASDPDLYIMLATGRYVAQTGHAPTIDLWSHTAYGQPWPMHEWLSSLLFYGLFVAWGINGIVIFKALALALAFILGLQIMRLRGASPFAALLTLALALLLLNHAFAERIQVISFVFFVLALYLLELFRSGRIKKWLFFSWSAIMFITWANMHLGYIIGLGLYGLALIDGLFIGVAKKDWDFLKWATAAFSLALLSTGITPYGFGLTIDALKIFTDPVSQQFDIFIWKSVLEHQPLLSPGFSREPFVIYGLIWIGFSGLGLILNAKKSRLSEWLLYAVFVYQTILVTRYLWFLAWLSFPFTAANWQGAWDTILSKIKRQPFGKGFGTLILVAQGRKTKTSPEHGKNTGLSNGIKNPGNVAFVGLVLLILTGAAMFQRSGEHLWQRFRLGWRPRMNSERGVQFLKQHRGESRVFNDFDIGAYLLWQQVPVFSDGRIAPFMKTQVLQDQLKIYAGQLHLLDKYQIDWIFLPYSLTGQVAQFEMFNKYLIDSKNWALVFWDDACLIYVRNNEKYRDLIKTYGMVVNPALPDLNLPPEIFLKEMESKAKEDTKARMPYVMAGNYYFSRNLPDQAEKQFKVALQNDPTNGILYNNLGNVYLRQGKIDQAIAAYKQAVKYDVNLGLTYCNWGYVLETQGKIKEAEKLYITATKVSIGDAWPYNRLGVIEAKRGNRYKAMEYWRKGAALDPNSEAAQNLRKVSGGY